MIPVEQPGITFRLRSGVSPWSAIYVVDSLDTLR